MIISPDWCLLQTSSSILEAIQEARQLVVDRCLQIISRGQFCSLADRGVWNVSHDLHV